MSRITHPSSLGILDDDEEFKFYPVRSSSGKSGLEEVHYLYIYQNRVQNTFGSNHAANILSGRRGDDGNVSVADDEIGWKSIHVIDPVYGVNLKEIVFENLVENYVLQYSTCPAVRQDKENEHGIYYAETFSKNRVGYIGSDFFVCWSTRENEGTAVFVTTFCKCKFCKVPWQNNELFGEQSGRTIEFDTLSLKPVNMTLMVKFNKNFISLIKRTFRPGVTNQFDIKNDKDDCNFLSVVYYCSIPLKSLPIGAFQRLEDLDTSYIVTCLKHVTIEIIAVTKTHLPVPMQSQRQSIFKALFEKNEHTDVTVVSKDGVPFHCNKSILSVRSTVFQGMLASGNFVESQQGRVQLEEEALAVQAILKFIYFQDIGLEGLSLGGMIGTLKLAHFFNFMELMVTVAGRIMRKIRNLEWEDATALWVLYGFVRHLDTIQVIGRLKISTIMELRRLILGKMEKSVRQDEEDVTECVNWAFANIANLAKDFAIDLLRLVVP